MGIAAPRQKPKEPDHIKDIERLDRIILERLQKDDRIVMERLTEDVTVPMV